MVGDQQEEPIICGKNGEIDSSHVMIVDRVDSKGMQQLRDNLEGRIKHAQQEFLKTNNKFGKLTERSLTMHDELIEKYEQRKQRNSEVKKSKLTESMEIENESVKLNRKVFDNISIKIEEVKHDEDMVCHNLDLKILWRLAMKLSFLKNELVLSVIPSRRIQQGIVLHVSSSDLLR